MTTDTPDRSASCAGDIARWMCLYNNGPHAFPVNVVVKWDAAPEHVQPPVYEWDDPPTRIEVSPQVFHHLRRIADEIELRGTPWGVLWPEDRRHGLDRGRHVLGDSTWRRTQREMPAAPAWSATADPDRPWLRWPREFP